MSALVWVCGTAGSPVIAAAGLSHLHLPPATRLAVDSTECGAVVIEHATGSVGSAFTSGSAVSQQLLGFSDTASQQLSDFSDAVFSQHPRFFGFGFGGGGAGLEQQHASAARSGAEQAQVAAAQSPGFAGAVSLADVATGNATTGVNWPNRARTAKAVRR